MGDGADGGRRRRGGGGGEEREKGRKGGKEEDGDVEVAGEIGCLQDGLRFGRPTTLSLAANVRHVGHSIT